MPFNSPEDVTTDDNGLTVDGDIQIDAFSNIARFGPQVALSVLVNATDTFSTPVFLASAATAGFTLQVNGTGDALIWAAGGGGGGGSFYQTIRDNGTPETQRAFLNVLSTTSIIAAAADDAGNTETELTWQRAALTGDVTAAQDVNTTAFRTFSAKSVLANATNASAIPIELAGSAAFQHLRVNSTNTGLEWAVLTVAAPITLTSDTIGFDSTANLDNNARVGVRKNTAGSTFLRRRLNLIEGTGVSLTVADDAGSEEVDVTVTATGISLSAIADQRVLGNDSGTSAVPVATTVHQTLDWVGGSSPVSWLFDGIDDRVNFGDVRDFQRTDPFTLSGWFQTATGANDSLWVKQASGTPFTGYFVEIETGFIRFFFRGTSIGNEISVRTNAATFADGSRHNVVISYSGSSLASGVNIDVDGVPQAVTVETNTLSTSTLNAGNLYIAFPSAGSFDGLLTDMAIWDVELTAPQRIEVYGSGTPPDLTSLPTAPDPVKWIKMDSSDATGANGIIDYGTDGVDGTAEGSLAPVSGVGSILARGSTLWQIVPPSAAGFPLASNGVGFVPSYRQLVLGAFPTMAAGSFLANVTGSTAVPTAHDLATFAGAGLTYTNVTGILAVGSSTSIAVNANDIQRAALTGAITAAANSNATAFGVLAAKSVLANATNASAVPAALAGSAAFQHLRVNSANNALEWAVLTVTAPITLTSDNIGFDQTATLGNNARIAVNKNSGATVGTRRRLNFIEGAGTTLTIADDAGSEEVDITIASAPAAGTVTPTMLSVFGTPTNTGVPFMIYVSYAAAAAGTPDDVTIFSASAPFNFRILEAWAVTSTAILLSTVECRTATGGGGSALTTAMSTTVTGKTSDNSTVTTTVAASGSVFIRRSDRGVAGELFIMAVRT